LDSEIITLNNEAELKKVFRMYTKTIFRKMQDLIMKGILEIETYRFLYMHSKKINSED